MRVNQTLPELSWSRPILVYGEKLCSICCQWLGLEYVLCPVGSTNACRMQFQRSIGDAIIVLLQTCI